MFESIAPIVETTSAVLVMGWREDAICSRCSCEKHIVWVTNRGLLCDECGAKELYINLRLDIGKSS